jgi:hypothetical protein
MPATLLVPAAPGPSPSGWSSAPRPPGPMSARAMVTLHARDRAQLVVLAYQTGLVRPRADVTSADAQPFSVAT